MEEIKESRKISGYNDVNLLNNLESAHFSNNDLKYITDEYDKLPLEEKIKFHKRQKILKDTKDRYLREGSIKYINSYNASLFFGANFGTGVINKGIFSDIDNLNEKRETEAKITIFSQNVVLFGKIFHIPENLLKSFELTNNKIHTRKMPFWTIFLNCDVYFDNKIWKGIGCGGLNKEGKMSSKKEDIENLWIYTIGEDLDSKKMCLLAFDLNAKLSKRERKFALIICNFLDFLNNPEIKYTKAIDSNEREFKQIKRHYEMFNIDLDKVYFVNITRPLKIQIEHIAQMDKMPYSYRFWIRGHFRTLKSKKRYGENVGKRIWIVPYIKGEGILIEKEYKFSQGNAKHYVVRTKKNLERLMK